MGLLRIKPYSKITVTELCRLADINRGTFYIHYFDVDDVLDDIVTESFSDVSQTIPVPIRFARRYRKIKRSGPCLWMRLSRKGS